jgi:hypothetical protein
MRTNQITTIGGEQEEGAERDRNAAYGESEPPASASYTSAGLGLDHIGLGAFDEGNYL